MLPFAALALPPESDGKKPLPLYNYHSVPPFVVGEGSGMAYDLGKYLARHMPGEAIDVVDLPRKRLDLAIKSSTFRGAVLLVSPLWFDDVGMKKYSWTKPIIVDEDVIVSPIEHRVDYSAPQSLRGKSIGIVLGYQYPMFDDMIAKGDIARVDTGNEKSGLMMLTVNRLDTIVIARSALAYLQREMKVDDKIFVAKIPVNRYERRVLVSRNNPHLKAALDAVIAKLPNDPEWKSIMEKYGVGELH